MGLRAKNDTSSLHILLDSSGQKSDYKVNQPLGTSHTMLPSLVKTKLKPTGWKLALKPTKRSVLQNFGCIFYFLIQHKIAGDRSCSEWKDFSFKRSGVFLRLDDQCDPDGALWLPQNAIKFLVGEQRCSTVLLNHLWSGSGCRGDTYH